MYAKFFVAALFASVSFLATASPNFVPEPEKELSARQDAGDVFNSLTSIAASIVTGPGGSIFTQATSVAGGAVSEATSAIAGVGGSIFTEVTSAGGRAFTVVTSEGGRALTLAESGIPTSAFGSVYTVATAAVLPSTSSSTSAAGLHAVTAPTIVGLAAVLGSVLLGAVVAF